MPLSHAALDALVANHRRFLDFLTARVGSRADAEEILQDAFLRGLSSARAAPAPLMAAWTAPAVLKPGCNAAVRHPSARP